jgi:hypothetical protein
MSARTFLLAGASLALVAAAQAEQTALLKQAATFALNKEGKPIGQARVQAGVMVSVVETRDGRALVRFGNAEPLWIAKDQLHLLSAESDTETVDRPEEPKNTPSPKATQIADSLVSAVTGIKEASDKLKGLLTSPEQGKENRTLQLRLWVDREKKTPGLEGTYFDGKLSNHSGKDLKLVGEGVSRVDEGISFEPRGWGSRRKMRISGGERSRWKDFTVQWDGWVELDGPGRLTLKTDGGSRMWVDANDDGEFGDSVDEFIDNGWGGKRRNAFGCSAMLPPGVYRVRINYEGSNNENSAKLEATDGCVEYRDFKRNTHRLYPWEGRNIVLLTEAREHDPELIGRLVDIFDKTFDYFARVTGRKPNTYYAMNNKTTIAEVPETCGAGCGMIGATGVEMTRDSFAGHLEDLQRDGQIRSLVMWEFGRNFFFYEGQMRYKSPDRIGIKNTFAAVMRTLVFRDEQLPMQPFMVEVSESHDQDLDGYVADISSNFDNTLRINAGTGSSRDGGWKLMAAMIIRLHRDYGGAKFNARFWQAMGRQPKAETTQDAIDNFARAACLAAEKNLTGLLRGPWKLPISDSVADAMLSEFGAPSS